MDKMHQVVLEHNKNRINNSEDFQSKFKGGVDKKSYRNSQKFKKLIEKGKNLYEIRKAKQETEQFLVYKFLEKENLSKKDDEIKTKVTQTSEIFDKNTEVIEKQLERQKKSIQTKLMERKERSISRSRIKDRQSQNKKIENTDNILKGLGKQESDDYFG